MKKIICIVLACIMCFSCVACSSGTLAKEIAPQISQMKAICELATMECYYHNVAKYFEDDASGSLWWKKDRKFWVEYAGVVTIGIDTSLVNIEVDDENVIITIPPAKVLGCKVDQATLNVDSFIIANNSAEVKAEHQSKAFMEAQSKMQEEASNDIVLLKDARQKAQKLLEDYVNNIGNCVGKTYKIKWIYLDNEENQQDMSTENQ